MGVQCTSNHIGASGLIFGWLAFLIVFGFFTRNAWEIVVGVAVHAARTGAGTYLDVLLVVALVAFIGTTSVGRFIERRGAR